MTCSLLPVSLKGEGLLASWRQTIDGINRKFDSLTIEEPVLVKGNKFGLPRANVYVENMSGKKFIRELAEAIGSSEKDIEKVMVRFTDDVGMFQDPFDKRITHRITSGKNKVRLDIISSSEKEEALVTADLGMIKALDKYMDKEEIIFGCGYGASEDLILYSSPKGDLKIRIIGTISMCKNLMDDFHTAELDLEDIAPNPLYAW